MKRVVLSVAMIALTGVPLHASERIIRTQDGNRVTYSDGDTQATGALSVDPNIPYEAFVDAGPYNQGPVAANEAQSLFNRLAAAWAQQQKTTKEKK